MGQKTSIYLTDDLAARSAATGLPPGEIYRRGLEAVEHSTERETLENTMRRVVREETDPGAAPKISVLTRQDDNTWNLVGSFDYRKAERFRSSPDRPGSPQDLYRTIEGRWVLSITLATTPGGDIGAHTYITDDEARAWLRENGHEQALQRFASVG